MTLIPSLFPSVLEAYRRSFLKCLLEDYFLTNVNIFHDFIQSRVLLVFWPLRLDKPLAPLWPVTESKRGTDRGSCHKRILSLVYQPINLKILQNYFEYLFKIGNKWVIRRIYFIIRSKKDHRLSNLWIIRKIRFAPSKSHRDISLS